MSTRFVGALCLLKMLAPTAVLADGVAALVSYGIVEKVREVRVTEAPPALSGVFELTYRPPSADELVVTLDDGRAITVVHTGTQIFEPRQRVRVVLDGPGVRVEKADTHSLP